MFTRDKNTEARELTRNLYRKLWKLEDKLDNLVAARNLIQPDVRHDLIEALQYRGKQLANAQKKLQK